jgi:Fe2+ transport system protein FeoA
LQEAHLNSIYIDLIPSNSEVQISDIEGGKQLQTKIFQLGLMKGDTVYVLQNPNTGPLILLKDHIKIAIGKGMAKKIKVTPLKKGEEEKE